MGISYGAAVFSRKTGFNSFIAVVRPSVCLSVGNTCAPYSGGCKFQQYFYGIWHLGHPLTSMKNFMETVPGEPLRQGS